MKKLIHKYLSEYYYVCDTFIYSKTIDQSMLPSRLFSELIKITGLTKKELKWYIKSWVLKQHKNFDFNTWWDYGNLFTISSSNSIYMPEFCNMNYIISCDPASFENKSQIFISFSK